MWKRNVDVVQIEQRDMTDIRTSQSSATTSTSSLYVINFLEGAHVKTDTGANLPNKTINVGAQASRREFEETIGHQLRKI